MISTWLLIVTLNGHGSALPAHTIVIPDMPSQQECQRVGQVLDDKFVVKKALCLEVRKTKP
jgi:hypothetical protein